MLRPDPRALDERTSTDEVRALQYHGRAVMVTDGMAPGAARMTAVRRRWALLASALGIAIAALTGCGDHGVPDDGERAIRLAPMSVLSPEIRQAPVAVRDAYRFAVANSALLAEVPCYCGCGAMGHASNAACYLAPDHRADAPAFDGHALGCSICVDITQDVMRLVRQGRSASAIRAYVDSTYARFGPSNIP